MTPIKRKPRFQVGEEVMFTQTVCIIIGIIPLGACNQFIYKCRPKGPASALIPYREIVEPRLKKIFIPSSISFDELITKCNEAPPNVTL